MPVGVPPGWFDIAVSNQVIEHVEALTPFLRNLREALAPNGISVHLFPLSHCMQEAHVRVPFSPWIRRSEEHTSELQSLMPISSAVFCLNKNIIQHHNLRSYHHIYYTH